MDYEKKYKEALGWARKVMQGKVGFVLDEVLEKFPELKESEDERISKELIEFLKGSHYIPAKMGRWIAWLEKQGEKSAEWSEEDESWLNDIIGSAEQEALLDKEQISWLKSLRPQSNWKPSEGQMEALTDAMDKYCGMYKATLCSLYNDLKKLKE